MNELVALPVLIPLVGASLCILLGRSRAAQRAVSLSALTATTVLSIVLLVEADRDGPLVVQSGGWPAPIGITLVVDRLSGIMLTVGSLMLLAVLVFAIGQPGAERNHVGFQSTYLILAAGVAGSFIVGDLFTLVRLLRDDAHRQLRPAHPRWRTGAGARRDDLRRHQPAGLDPVHHRPGLALRGDGHRQHGRLGGQDRCPPGRPRSSVRCPARRRLRHQGRAVPAVLVAPRQLSRGAVGGHRGVCRPTDQGRGVRADPHADAVVQSGRSSSHTAARTRRLDNGGRDPRRPRSGRRQAHPVVQHRQPHRLHGDGLGVVLRRRDRRRRLLHTASHRGEDDTVPHRRPDRARRWVIAAQSPRQPGAVDPRPSPCCSSFRR